MNTLQQALSNSKPKRKVDFDIDTPYFRRSMMMREAPELQVVALRIEQFLGERGIVQVSVEDAPVDDISRHTDPQASPLSKSEGTVKTRLSSVNISLGENNLYMRRKTSANPSPVSLAPQDPTAQN